MKKLLEALSDFLEGLLPWERAAFDRAVKEDANYYVLNFTNKGGLVMPIILGLMKGPLEAAVKKEGGRLLAP